MRKIRLYSVYDKKGDRYDTPFFARNDINAQRHFILMAEQNGSMIHRFVNDFEVVNLGEFDVLSGELKVNGKKTLIMEGIQIKKESDLSQLPNGIQIEKEIIKS